MPERPITIGSRRPRVSGVSVAPLRGTTAERGYSSDWQRARVVFLLDNPLCAHCLRRMLSTPATEVDHIKPIQHRPDLRMDADNWQALCKPCHSRKTAAENPPRRKR